MANALEIRTIAVLATLCSLWMVPVICQDRVSVLKDNSKVLLCEHGAAAIASFTWKKGTNVLIQGFISNGQTTIIIDSMPARTELLLQNGSPNMRLDNIDIGDEGIYSCEATEQGGALTTVTSELLVRVQPSRPQLDVQYDPQPSDMSIIPLNTTVTFTCTSTGGRPPASLTWNGKPASATPTYTSSNDSQGVGDSTSTFNFTTAEYGVTYSVYCRARGPDPIQTRISEETTFKTVPDPSVTTTPKGQTVVTSVPISKSPGQDGTNAPRTGAGLGTGGVVGIVIGVLVAIIVALALVYFLVIRKKRAGGGEKDGVESGNDEVTYHAAGHPGAPENMSRPPPNQPEVMYAELDLKNAPAGSRKPYVATPDDSPTEYAQIRPSKPPRSTVPHTLAPDDKTEYASITKPKPGKRLDLQAV